MWKLLKVEFRRARTAMLALLGVAGVLEIYFCAALLMTEEHPEHLIISVVLLALAAYGALLFVLIRGVTSYSTEMKAKSAYLLFMTPNSGYKIMASKYLYTFVNGLLMGAICAALAAVDVVLMLTKQQRWSDMLDFFNRVLNLQGVQTGQIALAVLFYLVLVVLSLLSFFAVAYFAITLSHTLLRDKKGRTLVAVLVFVALNFLLTKVQGLLPNPVEQLVFTVSETTSSAGEMEPVVQGFNDMIPSLLLYGALDLVVFLASAIGCGWMLEKKVSL